MKIGYRPIGVIRTPYGPDTACPHQPLVPPRGEARIELEPEWVEGLHRLESFEYLIVLFHMDRTGGRPATRVEPPWAGGVEVGLFASRSPERPNPIGLSIVKLLRVEGNVVYTSMLDVYDGTPVLDIKPYVALLDAKEDAGNGWLDELDDPEHAVAHLLGKRHDHDHDHRHHDHDDHGHDGGHHRHD